MFLSSALSSYLLLLLLLMLGNIINLPRSWPATALQPLSSPFSVLVSLWWCWGLNTRFALISDQQVCPPYSLNPCSLALSLAPMRCVCMVFCSLSLYAISCSYVVLLLVGKTHKRPKSWPAAAPQPLSMSGRQPIAPRQSIGSAAKHAQPPPSPPLPKVWKPFFSDGGSFCLGYIGLG